MKYILALAIGLYQSFICIGSKLQSPLLLIIRLYWGWEFFLTGKGKLMDLGKVTGFFQSLGIPFPAVNAVLAGSTECFGGLLLLLGLASRPASLALSFTMIVAYVTSEQEALHAIYSDPDKFLTAAPFQFLLAAVLVLAFGPGYFSLDKLLAVKFFAKPTADSAKKGCC